jgi:hypothetical protein
MQIKDENEPTTLADIDHHIQAGFLTVVTILRQIRDGQKGQAPTRDDVEKSAGLLHDVSRTLIDRQI